MQAGKHAHYVHSIMKGWGYILTGCRGCPLCQCHGCQKKGVSGFFLCQACRIPDLQHSGNRWHDLNPSAKYTTGSCRTHTTHRRRSSLSSASDPAPSWNCLPFDPHCKAEENVSRKWHRNAHLFPQWSPFRLHHRGSRFPSPSPCWDLSPNQHTFNTPKQQSYTHRIKRTSTSFLPISVNQTNFHNFFYFS
jgi:hypothetical protein